jgi:hypothetical protein
MVPFKVSSLEEHAAAAPMLLLSHSGMMPGSSPQLKMGLPHKLAIYGREI